MGDDVATVRGECGEKAVSEILLQARERECRNVLVNLSGRRERVQNRKDEALGVTVGNENDLSNLGNSLSSDLAGKKSHQVFKARAFLVVWFGKNLLKNRLAPLRYRHSERSRLRNLSLRSCWAAGIQSIPGKSLGRG